MPADPWLVLAAGAVEATFGYPDRLHARLPHPVAWIAKALNVLERRLNRGSPLRQRLRGVATLLAVGGAAGAIGYVLDRFLAGSLWGFLLAVALGSLGLAAGSLHRHVAPVAQALEAGDLPAARAAVARIVGRDVEALDEAGVAAAALESLAESFNDGVVAPLCWFLFGGLAGLFVYKVVNTADSVIGHKEAPYTWFGWAAARTDYGMNFIPARLAGSLIAVVGGGGWAAMFRDAGAHPSPNAGWPEAAMAGALGVRLGGPVRYDGVLHDRPAMGQGRAATAADLRHGLVLYRNACVLIALVLALGGLLWPR